MSCDKTLFSSFITTNTLFVKRLKYIERITFGVQAEAPRIPRVNGPTFFI